MSLSTIALAGLQTSVETVPQARATLLIVHGAFSRRVHLEHWAPLLAQHGYASYLPSLPGHEPDSPHDLGQLTLTDYRDRLLAALLELPRPRVVIGHSMGGLLAQQLAASGAVEALICVTPAPPWRLLVPARAFPYIAPLLPRVLAGKVLRPARRALAALLLHDAAPAQREALLGSFGHESGRALRAMVVGPGKIAPASVKCPVLCLTGEDDRMVSRRTARKIAAHYHAQLVEYPARGHWLVATPGWEGVVDDAVQWLNRLPFEHLSSPPAA